MDQNSAQYFEQRPSLKELQCCVLLDPTACSNWESLGIKLNLADDDDGAYLDEVAERYAEDSKRLLQVFKKWLRQSDKLKTTWGCLLEALKTLKLQAVVEKVESHIRGNQQEKVATLDKPATPEGQHKMAATPETQQEKATTPESQREMAATPESQQEKAATPESQQEKAATPENQQEKATTPESQQEMAETPEGQQEPATIIKSRGPHDVHEPVLGPNIPFSIPTQNQAAIESPLNQATVDNADIADLPHPLPEPEAASITNFSIKMKEGWEVRRYQQELAQPGINGENYIIVAPTGSGKTLVSALVISDHLTKFHGKQRCHVVFVVNTKPLAEQQHKQLKEFIPTAGVGVYTGDSDSAVADSIKERNDISVCTAGKLLDEIRKGKVHFGQLSLMVFDECHHTRKGHPYARLMEHYMESRDEGTTCPQIVGLTASPGAGDNSDLDKEKTIEHLLKLAALMDATGGLKSVSKPENVQELQRSTKSSSSFLKILPPRDPRGDRFIGKVEQEMAMLEHTVPNMKKSSFKRWSQEYETSIQQIKLPLESSTDKTVRDQISTLNLLRCYSNALSVYMDLQQKDAIKELEKYSGLPEDSAKATPYESNLKLRLKALLDQVKTLQPRHNPLLENMREILSETFEGDPTSRAIIFVRTKKHAYALQEWILEHPRLRGTIKPGVITGHTRETGAGMTQVEQVEVMTSFRKGTANLLIATSVAEEGLDVPECNLMIRFSHVSNEIAKVQTEGRARADNAQGFTILPSDSRKTDQERKNGRLVKLVDEILEKRWFPTGMHLQSEIARIQRELTNQRKLKALQRAQLRQSHANTTVKLTCKKCKEFACYGSDVCTIGANYYVVPHPDFKEKYITKEDPEPTIHNGVRQTDKIHCGSCEKQWGVKCIWPTDGFAFPVIKCSSFNFEMDGCPRIVKKWTEAPFEVEGLSHWLEKNRDTRSSESDSEDGSD